MDDPNPTELQFPADLQARLDAAGVHDNETLQQALAADPQLSADFVAFLQANPHLLATAAIDDLVRHKTLDAPTIGLVLCKSKKGTVVEYALRDIHTPMGVSTYRTALPDAVADVLPSIEVLTEELQALSNEDDLEVDG